MSSKNNETAPQTAGFKKEIGVFGGISIIGGIMHRLRYFLLRLICP